MKFTYTVTEEDYITLLTGFIRKRDQKPVRRIMLFLLTAGQMGLVAWLCAARLDRSQWAFYIVWSVLLAAITLLRHFTAKQRAKGTLYRLKDNGQLPEDYWKPHTLAENKEGLALIYGSVRMECPRGSLTDFYEEEGLLYLKAGEGIFDIIPLTAFRSGEQKEKFLEELAAFRDKMPVSGEETEPKERKKENRSYCSVAFSMSGDEFIKLETDAFRSIYLRYQFTEARSLLKLAATIFLIAVAAMNFSAGTAVMAAAFTVLLNRNHFLVLTPLLRFRVKKELGAWAEGGIYELSAEEDGIRMKCGSQKLLVPYGKINASGEFRVGQLYSWGRLPAAVVPSAVVKTEAGAAFLKEVTAFRQPIRYGKRQ